MIEKLLLSTFDFIGNEDDNNAYRYVNGCKNGDCIIPIPVNDNDIPAGQEIVDITEKFRNHMRWLWLDSGNKILPFVNNIFGTSIFVPFSNLFPLQ